MTPKQTHASQMLAMKPRLLWSLVRRQVGECWNWIGSTNEDGYGSVRVGPTSILAHRAAYMLQHGLIAEGMCVCHQCDNPKCCNPAHLFLGSHSQNMGDMKSKGRRKGIGSGENNGRAKLTPASVSDIREHRANGWLLKDLARIHGVGLSTISRACRGENWT